MIKLLFAYISFKTEFDLSITVEKISQNLFGGLLFKPNRSKDEVPALSANYLLGHQILISGVENEYILEIREIPIFFKDCNISNLEEQNMNELIKYHLSKMDGFELVV